LTDTFARLMALINAQYHLDTTHVTLSTGLADAGLDSLAVAELLFSIEEDFGIDLGDVSPDAIPATVGEVVSLVDGKLRPA
jgi:acyl carrier protein